GDLGIAMQDDGIAIGMQREAAVHRRSESGVLALLEQGQSTLSGIVVQHHLEGRLAASVINDNQLVGCTLLRVQHALDAPPRQSGVSVHRNDDVNDQGNGRSYRKRGQARFSPTLRPAAVPLINRAWPLLA